ncbi:hypothetical protein C8R44DRAFT_872020 [Mycena epipterygia]|nr:hypothetical protein C8R44DRAFT_872020 [Mycena epipterygia]
MFSLIRRFSGSVIPRPDRPWEEDPTSNAPHVGRKRRMADEDRDEDDEEQSRLKKVRAATSESQTDAPESSSTPLPETAGVKEVTEGVKEVELEEKPQALPESVPLPEEKAGELDADSSSTASTPPPTGEPEEPSENQDTVVSAEAPPATTELVSGEAVSDPIVADTEAATEVVATPVAADAITADAAAPDARPIKKLRKQKTASAPVAPTES